MEYEADGIANTEDVMCEELRKLLNKKDADIQ